MLQKLLSKYINARNFFDSASILENTLNFHFSFCE